MWRRRRAARRRSASAAALPRAGTPAAFPRPGTPAEGPRTRTRISPTATLTGPRPRDPREIRRHKIVRATRTIGDPRACRASIPPIPRPCVLRASHRLPRNLGRGRRGRGVQRAALAPEVPGPPPNDEGPENADFDGDSVNDHANDSHFTLDNDEPGVPKSVVQIHNELARGVDTGRAPSALYRESGVLIPYATPEYPRVTSKETDKWAMLEWQEKHLREAASRRKKTDIDSNCKLDMAHFLLKTEITHRQYRALHELHQKYIPQSRNLKAAWTTHVLL